MDQLQLTTEPRAALPPAARRGRRRRSSHDGHDGARIPDASLARGLGWLGIGLGVLEVAAPRRLTRMLGLAEHDTLVRLVGLREVASGVGILAQPRPTSGVWARFGGDIVDLALLGAAFTSSRRKGRVAASLAAVGSVTLLDLLVGDRLARRPAGKAGPAPRDGSIELTESVVIAAAPAQVYAYWRQLENLPTFMKHLLSVQEQGQRRSHWVARAPGGGTVEWDAEIVDEVPDELIAWRSTEGAGIENSGRVRFAAERAGRGTLIEVELRYKPPLGGAGALVAKLFGEEPGQQLKEDLRRLKQVVETGEIPTTQGQSSGRRAQRASSGAQQREVKP